MTTTNKLPIWWLLILVPMGIILTALFFTIFGDKFTLLLKSFGLNPTRLVSVFVYNIATGIAVLVYYILLKLRGLNFKRAGYRGKITKEAIIYMIAGAAIVIFLYPIIMSLLKVLNIPMFWNGVGQTAVKQQTNIDIILACISAVILAPLTEDTIFRGYVFEMLKERYSKWTAIIIASIIFALIHIPFFGPGLAIYMVFWTIISCLLYHKFNNIYSSIGMHMINNVFAYIVIPMIIK